jgi:hypothetical protein
LIPTDIGYIALLTVLVIVPTAAVLAAVVDRMVKRRRNGIPQKSASPNHAFPVIADPNQRVENTPTPVQPIRSRRSLDS